MFNIADAQRSTDTAVSQWNHVGGRAASYDFELRTIMFQRR
jgi:hypothetical protein